MRKHRVYVSESLAVGKRIVLEEKAALHLTRVLRLNPGDTIYPFNGDGIEYQGVLLKSKKQHCQVEILGDFFRVAPG